MQSLIRFGVMPMEIKDRIADMRDKLKRMKSQRGILTKVQIFKFQPFSRRQKQVLHLVDGRGAL